jgi:hypothetical protein
MGGDWSSLDSSFIAQVLDVPTDAMQLELSDELRDMTNQIVSSNAVSETDTVGAVTDWSKVFKSREGSVVVRAGLGLAKTNTTNDSIGFTITTDTNVTETVLGEPLVMVAQDTTNPVKTFSTSNTNAVYTLGNVVDVDGVGEVKGNLTVRGRIGWNGRSTLDLNNKMGFVLNDADSVLTLSSMTIKNGHATNHTQSSVAYVNNGRLYVDNVIFKDNVSEAAQYWQCTAMSVSWSAWLTAVLKTTRQIREELYFCLRWMPMPMLSATANLLAIKLRIPTEQVVQFRLNAEVLT